MSGMKKRALGPAVDTDGNLLTEMTSKRSKNSDGMGSSSNPSIRVSQLDCEEKYCEPTSTDISVAAVRGIKSLGGIKPAAQTVSQTPNLLKLTNLTSKFTTELAGKHSTVAATSENLVVAKNSSTSLHGEKYCLPVKSQGEIKRLAELALNGRVARKAEEVAEDINSMLDKIAETDILPITHLSSSASLSTNLEIVRNMVKGIKHYENLCVELKDIREFEELQTQLHKLQ